MIHLKKLLRIKMYRYFIKPILFLFDPEQIHHIVFKLIRLLSYIPFYSTISKLFFSVNDTRLERTVFGIRFPNPVGLAAGFDKDGKLFNELSALGFGFIEIGTLTPLSQEGNPKPRLFRLPKDQALINRMGFNNEGVDKAVERLRKRHKNSIIGGNIGKNKITPNEHAIEDYEKCFNKLVNYVDYFVVNVSSPNTPNLRALQEKEPLKKLLNHLQNLNQQQSKPKPILLKIAPDLDYEQLDDIVEIVKETKIAGVIATNTTISREHLQTSLKELNAIGAGGLSGKPLCQRSTEVIRYLHQKSEGRFPIIGVGGIHSPEDALEKLDAGATLVQLYTGFIYEGPALVRNINKAILKSRK